jgi:hypothetical protein
MLVQGTPLHQCALKYDIYTFSRRARNLDNNDVLTFALDGKS